MNRAAPTASREQPAAAPLAQQPAQKLAGPQGGAQALTVSVTPMGKPRMTQRDKWKKRPVVLRYRDFCDELRAKTAGFPLTDALSLHFVLPMPKSWAKKKKLALINQPHQQRPDSDNLAKSVLDALFKEDSTVHTLHITKTWGDKGSITITNLEGP